MANTLGPIEIRHQNRYSKFDTLVMSVSFTFGELDRESNSALCCSLFTASNLKIAINFYHPHYGQLIREEYHITKYKPTE